MNKIFGIGLSHTGTNSLTAALNLLGIKTIHWPVDRQTYLELSSGNYRLSLLEHYQCITDITTVPFYPQFDRVYPGSKFILTFREKESWLRRMREINAGWKKYGHKNFIMKYGQRFIEDWRFYKLGSFKSVFSRMLHDEAIEFTRVATYGGLYFLDEERLSYVYDTHHKNVLEYFKDRTQDLLVIKITGGEGWDVLCPFVGKPVPSVAFPNIFNKRREIQKKL